MTAPDQLAVYDSWGDASTDVREIHFPGMSDTQLREAVTDANAALPSARWYLR